MIVSLDSFKKFYGVDKLEFMKTSKGRLMCVTQLPQGVPQVFCAIKITKPEEINALWLSHPKNDPSLGEILIAGSTKMTAGFEV